MFPHHKSKARVQVVQAIERIPEMKRALNLRRFSKLRLSEHVCVSYKRVWVYRLGVRLRTANASLLCFSRVNRTRTLSQEGLIAANLTTRGMQKRWLAGWIAML